MKKEDKKKWLWAAGLGVVLLAAVVCLFVIPKSGPGAASSAIPSSAPAPTAAASPTPLALARAENGDVVGWLSVPGTDIDDPVVQAADNEHYLRRTWERWTGSASSTGTALGTTLIESASPSSSATPTPRSAPSTLT